MLGGAEVGFIGGCHIRVTCQKALHACTRLGMGFRIRAERIGKSVGWWMQELAPAAAAATAALLAIARTVGIASHTASGERQAQLQNTGDVQSTNCSALSIASLWGIFNPDRVNCLDKSLPT